MKKLPFKHLSIRVPWHDLAWNGTICADPKGNHACTMLESIRNDRDDEWEAARIQTQVSGTFDMLHGTELIGAIEGFFHTQQRYSTTDNKDPDGLLVGVWAHSRCCPSAALSTERP